MSNFRPFDAAQSLGLNSVSPLVAGVAQTTPLVPNNFQVQSNLSSNGEFTLPASKVPDFRSGSFQRDIIHWFVPEFGIVKMYVNPTNITTRHSKLITQNKTKGGWTLQYWGENLSTMELSGTTGSSGIEGIEVLYQIYRAEQYAFDVIGLSLAADNAVLGATNQLLDGIGGAVANAIGQSTGNQTVGGITGASLAQGILGTNNAGTFAPRNIATLASVAFGIEMYYSGEINRGYFEEMTITERADNIGLFDYSLKFVVTQKRGYRLNTYPWQRSAIDGPSNNDTTGGIPPSWFNLSQ